MKTRLQELRKAAGYRSAKAYAEHLGLNVGTYTAYEQGRIQMSLEAAWTIADDLGCSLDELFGRDFTPEPPDSPKWESNGMRLIFEAYESMNPAGKAMLEEQADMLSSRPKYSRGE